MNHRIILPLLLAALAVGALVGPAAAAPTPAKKINEMFESAKLTKGEFESLIQQLDRLADMLENSKADLETAKVLREAATAARGALISDNMKEVMDHIKKGLMTMATQRGKEVEGALDEVLRILRQGTLTIDEKMENLKKMEDTLKAIGALKEEQEKLEKESRPKANADELSKRMAAHAKQLAGIIKKQKDMLAQAGKMPEGKGAERQLAALRDEIRDLIKEQEKVHSATASSSPAKLPLAAPAQNKLADKAKQTQAKLDQAAKDPKMGEALKKAGADEKAMASAASKVAQAAGEMKQASQSMSKSSSPQATRSQKNALHDLKAAEQALSQALAKTGEKTPGGQMAEKQKDLAKETEKLAEEVEKTGEKAGEKVDTKNLTDAAKDMDQAGEKLAGQQPKAAGEKMEDALKKLQRKEEQLAELKRRIDKKAKDPIQDQEKPQGDLAKKAEQKAQDMKGSDSQKPQAGQKSVASASKSMSKASKSAGQGKASQTNQEQNEAIKELDKAEKELEDAIAKEQDEIQAETLAKIDEMLRKALETQQNINSGTEKVFGQKLKDGSYARTDQAQLRELAGTQGTLAGDVEKIMKMLSDEGTTAVFPEVLAAVRKDMIHVQKQLAKLEAGPITQTVQHDIEQNLKSLLEAFRKEQSRRRKKQGGGPPPGGGGGGGKQPLVPPIAELRLLKTLQIQVFTRTKAVATAKVQKTAPADQIQGQHKELSERQGKLKTTTRELKVKLEKQQQQKGM